MPLLDEARAKRMRLLDYELITEVASRWPQTFHSRRQAAVWA